MNITSKRYNGGGYSTPKMPCPTDEVLGAVEIL
jgi:hypothetical protein